MKYKTLSAILFCAGVVVGWMLHPDTPPCEDAAELDNTEFKDSPETAQEDAAILSDIQRFRANRRETSIAAQRVIQECEDQKEDALLQFRKVRLQGYNS